MCAGFEDEVALKCADFDLCEHKRSRRSLFHLDLFCLI
jgi:hypothetical protein